MSGKSIYPGHKPGTFPDGGLEVEAYDKDSIHLYAYNRHNDDTIEEVRFMLTNQEFKEFIRILTEALKEVE